MESWGNSHFVGKILVQFTLYSKFNYAAMMLTTIEYIQNNIKYNGDLTQLLDC